MSSAAALKAWDTRRAIAAGTRAPMPPRRRFVGGNNAAALKAVATRRRNVAEWAALEAEQVELWRHAEREPVDVAPKYTAKPHPLSYRPDIALHFTPERIASTKIVVSIRPNAPHPASYRANLPLRGLGLSRRKATVKWTLTLAEKKALALRPLVWIAP